VSGFFGMVREDGRSIEERFLHGIAEKLNFRGLDSKNVWARDNVGGSFAGMRTGPGRQATQQPVIWQGRYFLWGDIRLDGRKELLQQLAENGQVVEGDPTSEELLLLAWAKWGEDALERVIGDFSFALWDAQEETLWCARDFIGARPLYYAHTRGVFCFSNTLEILRAVPELSGELDELFVADFLVEGWIVELNRTIYRDIRRVAPGRILKYSKGGEMVRRFRQLPIEDPLKFNHTEEYLEAYRGLLKPAVTDRLPKGATSLYLSGGLDSSSVCAVAAQIAGSRGQKEELRAFTLSWEAFFEDPEPAFAKSTANHLGITLEVLEDSKLVPFEGVEAGEVRIPEPGHELFFARKRRQAQRVALHSNVVLGGDGGDDIQTGQAWPHLAQLSQLGDWKEIARVFGGYFWTQKRIPPLRRGFRRKLRRLLKKEDPFTGYPEWLNGDFAARLNLRERWLESRNQNDEPGHPYHPRAYRALHDGYWGEVLEAEDAGWTRVRLETRSPLLDLRVLTFLLRLPPVPWCMDKKIGREAMKNTLPLAVVNRPKTPLRQESLDLCADHPEWISKLPAEAPSTLNRFVNWTKWCETFYHPKGSLSWIILRPVSLLYWLKAVENDQGIQ
jgi:asparagine synthase (glutamine-hydrolysing)